MLIPIFVLGILALNCSHSPRNDPKPSATALQASFERAERTPIRSLDDVPLGRYETVRGGSTAVTLGRSDSALILTTRHTDGRVAPLARLQLRPDGSFTVPGHHEAWIIRRDGETLLAVAYCYAFKVYRFTP